MSEKNWERVLRERDERRASVKELTEMGWRSTGDIPFSLERKIPNASSHTIETNMKLFLEAVLEKEGADYPEANIIKMGKTKTFFSPDLIGKIEEEVRAYYATMRSRVLRDPS